MGKSGRSQDNVQEGEGKYIQQKENDARHVHREKGDSCDAGMCMYATRADGIKTARKFCANAKMKVLQGFPRENRVRGRIHLSRGL